jgi:3-hydroxyanthranilate 3,4-dioxygenase
LEGNITVRIIEEDKIVPIEIKAGDMFLLPARVYHSPQRGPGSVGLVIEKVRDSQAQDSFSWYCENCSHKLYEVFLPVNDIVAQLPPVMNAFYADEKKRTCEKCGTVMQPPK